MADATILGRDAFRLRRLDVKLGYHTYSCQPPPKPLSLEDVASAVREVQALGRRRAMQLVKP
jgi:hypothetical protein